MSEAATGISPRQGLSLLAVPIALLLGGALLRYLAYASVNAQPSPQGFADAMCVWDCYWYGDIVVHGYQAYPETLNFGGPAGIANWAFFPLYPLLIAAIGKLVAVSPAALGAIVSPLLTLGAAFASWPLFNGDRRAHFLFAALLLIGPFSFYFSILYSESLFLLLTVLAFVALGRRNYVLAGVMGALLAATRTVGVLFVFAILAEAAFELWRASPRLRSLLPALLHRPDIVLGLLLVPLGVFAFMVWLHVVTGDALAFVHIQRAWDREIVNPVTGLWHAFVSPGGQTRDAPLLAVASLGGLVLCGVLFWKRQVPAAIFCTLCLVLALTNGVEFMLRFVAALAPLGIVLCQMLARWRWLFWLSLVVFVVLDFEWSIGWLHQQGSADVKPSPVLWLSIAVVAAFELYAATLVLRPNADATYRAYFIDKTSDCWPHQTEATYTLGTTLSFVDGKPNLFFPNKICGWFYPKDTGTWSYGSYSQLRFKFPPIAAPLRLTITAGAMVDAAHPEQSVPVSANGQSLVTLSFASEEPTTKFVDVPAALATSGTLDIRFDYPDARSGRELGPNEDSHLRAIRMVSLMLDKAG